MNGRAKKGRKEEMAGEEKEGRKHRKEERGMHGIEILGGKEGGGCKEV